MIEIDKIDIKLLENMNHKICKWKNLTYRSQSTAMINEMSSDGKPTVSRTITMVTNPADGIPAAPIEAAVAVTLYIKSTKNFITNCFIKNIEEKFSFT